MSNQSVFHLIKEITSHENVSCVLIGGFAVNHYKVSRQTADIDFLVTKEDFERILEALKNAGYKLESSNDNFVHFKSGRIALMDIDFMFVEKETLSKIMEQGEVVTIARQEFRVPSLRHLIALKLHSIKYNPKLRLVKDFPDIVGLVKINQVDIKDKDFKELCLKYGDDELYRRLLEILT